MPGDTVTDSIGFRCGSHRVEVFTELTESANYEKPAHFFKALVDRLEEIVDGPFDVRDITLRCGKSARKEAVKG